MASLNAVQVVSKTVQMIGDARSTEVRCFPELHHVEVGVGQKQVLQITQAAGTASLAGKAPSQPTDLFSVRPNAFSKAAIVTTASIQNGKMLQDAFQIWYESNFKKTTSSTFSMASFITRLTLKGLDIKTQPFDLTDATLPLLLARQSLAPRIKHLAKTELVKRNPSNPWHSSRASLQCTSKQKHHSCPSCVGLEGHWVLSCIRTLLELAHLASAAQEATNSIIDPETPNGLLPHSSQSSLARANEILGFATPGKRPFHHASSVQGSAGTLFIQ